MWSKCFRKHKNLFLIVCGDQGAVEAMHITLRGDAGNTVYALMADYVNCLRLYSFRPKENLIKVVTYDPKAGRVCSASKLVPEPKEHLFELPYSMAP